MQIFLISQVYLLDTRCLLLDFKVNSYCKKKQSNEKPEEREGGVIAFLNLSLVSDCGAKMRAQT